MTQPTTWSAPRVVAGTSPDVRSLARAQRARITEAPTPRPETPRPGGTLKRIGAFLRDLLQRDDLSDRIEAATGHTDSRVQTELQYAVFMNYNR